jgi:hypothetical protein
MMVTKRGKQEMKIIQATLDHRVCGAGHRVFVLVGQGPKFATLYEPISLSEFKIAPDRMFRVADLDLSKRQRRRMARRLEDRAQNFRRWGRIKWAKKTTKRVIENLKGD